MMRIVQYLLSAYVYDICIICAYMTYTLAYVYDICIICAHMTYTYMKHVHYVCTDMIFLCIHFGVIAYRYVCQWGGEREGNKVAAGGRWTGGRWGVTVCC